MRTRRAEPPAKASLRSNLSSKLERADPVRVRPSNYRNFVLRTDRRPRYGSRGRRAGIYELRQSVRGVGYAPMVICPCGRGGLRWKLNGCIDGPNPLGRQRAERRYRCTVTLLGFRAEVYY
ncbi:hypothetical protein EVAR_94726_1 [Eumeta japonica]|uniref:Uncharacterized protein n=1 Tax=Eumeta variegata TaxID=151549 RepID=A0A4C1UX15_EUMVA|nr:hypothetical protein EVAR_94726_1 [Eumeta japonica]